MVFCFRTVELRWAKRRGERWLEYRQYYYHPVAGDEHDLHEPRWSEWSPVVEVDLD